MKTLQFEVVNENLPGKKFSQLFNKNWSAYRAWYLDEGENVRPTYLECISAIKKYMPEIYPLYQQVIKLLDADDLQARFLSLYRPPPFFSACSQLIVKQDQPALIRNYDFPPLLCEGVILHSQWLDKKVIAMADCVWGALDGINEDGLAVSIAYGGRLVEGDGFGITIVIRYILETCSTVDDAVEVFRRVPVHLDYNIALVDRSGEHATVFIAPDREVCVTRATTSTNHQGGEEALFLKDSQIRLDVLNTLAGLKQQSAEETATQFLYPPLYRPHALYDSGTLYTAAYYPERGEVNYLWPHRRLALSFDSFNEADVQIAYE